MPLPAGPEQVFLSPLGTDIRILPGVRSGQGAYLPPETRLSPERITDGPEAVYRLCALLFHLLSGRILSVESLRARRADLRSGLLGIGLEMGAETALLALLDHGLRLEPSRRFPDPEALRTAMGEVQTILNQAAQARLCLEGDSGAVCWCAVHAPHIFSNWTPAGGMPDPVLSPCTRREPPPLPGGVGLGGSAGHRSGFPLWDIFEWDQVAARRRDRVGTRETLGTRF